MEILRSATRLKAARRKVAGSCQRQEAAPCGPIIHGRFPGTMTLAIAPFSLRQRGWRNLSSLRDRPPFGPSGRPGHPPRDGLARGLDCAQKNTRHEDGSSLVSCPEGCRPRALRIVFFPVAGCDGRVPVLSTSNAPRHHVFSNFALGHEAAFHCGRHHATHHRPIRTELRNRRRLLASPSRPPGGPSWDPSTLTTSS